MSERLSDITCSDINIKTQIRDFNRYTNIMRINDKTFIRCINNNVEISPIHSANFTGSVDFTGATVTGLTVSGFYDPTPLINMINLKADIANPSFTGNVGIGSATPTVALDVVGSGNFTGTVTANNFVGGGLGITSLGSINLHSDVNTVTVPPTIGSTLVWSGTNWIPGSSFGGLNDLIDAVITTPVAGEVLEYDGTQWVNAPNDHTLLFDTLTDVNLFGLALGDTIVFNGTEFVPTPGLANASIDALSDVDTSTTAPTVGQTLIWDGANWVPAVNTLASIDGHTDVDTSTIPPAVNDLLVWNGANWVAGAPTIGSIDVLNDVDTTTTAPTAGQTLTWDGTNWVPAANTLASIDGHTDVDTTTALPILNQALVWNGTTWVPGLPTAMFINDITDVDTVTNAPIIGQSLVWNGGNWVPGVNSSMSVDDLTDADTTTTAPAVGQALVWDGTNWIPGNSSTGAINDLIDVDTATTAPAVNDFLQWNGAIWVPITLPNIPININDLGDVDTATTAPGVNQLLQWNGTTWVPGNINFNDVNGVTAGGAVIGQPLAWNGTQWGPAVNIVITGTVTATTGPGGVAGGTVGLLTGTFTGQHYNKVNNIKNDEDYRGLIVSANNNKYMNLNGPLHRGRKAITIDEALPLLSLSKKRNDKSVFGVISGREISSSSDLFREQYVGGTKTRISKEVGDVRTIINSLGEGGIWVTNINGPLESGDYITTSNIPGYGQKQDSEFLANYTVAKITMDCNFNPEIESIEKIKKEDGENVLDENGELIWEMSNEREAQYDIRFLNIDGNIITKTTYNSMIKSKQKAYIAAFVGCTYHCG